MLEFNAVLLLINAELTEFKPLKFELKNRWSYRVGTYRIIYSIEHSVLIVHVMDIGHRREVYR